MSAAPLERPAKHEVLHSLAANIRARPAEVFAALDARLDPGAGASLRYRADADAGLIVAQGAWWYRAEYRVGASSDGATLEHELVNIAQRGERAALVTGAKVAAEAPLAFHALVRSIRAQLESSAGAP